MHRGRSVARMAGRVAVWAGVVAVGVVVSMVGHGKGMGKAGVVHAAFSGRNPVSELVQHIFLYCWNQCQNQATAYAGGVLVAATVVLVVTAKWPRQLHQ